MKILVIADSFAHFKTYKDTTYAILRELARRSLRLFYAPKEALLVRKNEVKIEAEEFIFRGKDAPNWYEFKGEKQVYPLADFNATLMRSDPPFDTEYLYATQLFTLAEEKGVKIFNSGKALRDFNEKLAILYFPQFITPTVVTSRIALLLDFLQEEKDIIVKPLDGMGGREIFRLREKDPNTHSILESLTRYNTRTIMAQKYIPAVKEGDKRVLIIDGKPLDYALARLPQADETRANLAAGGHGVAQELSARDREIAETLAPELKKRGIFFAGLDIIGDYLTEINVTSPTGFQEIMGQKNYDVAKIFVDALLKKL